MPLILLLLLTFTPDPPAWRGPAVEPPLVPQADGGYVFPCLLPDGRTVILRYTPIEGNLP